MKYIFILSTGRTGTKKLGELLQKNTEFNCKVEHQTDLSRTINILGNMNYAGLPVEKKLKKSIQKLLDRNKNYDIYINTDPLVSFALKPEYLKGLDCKFLHVIREQKSFVKSFINWQFTRPRSFLAHNFIPFWQPGLLPLENLAHLYNKRHLIQKYSQIWLTKNKYFEETFGNTNSYLRINFREIFDKLSYQKIFNKISDFTKITFKANIEDINRKSNISKENYVKESDFLV